MILAALDVTRRLHRLDKWATLTDLCLGHPIGRAIDSFVLYDKLKYSVLGLWVDETGFQAERCPLVCNHFHMNLLGQWKPNARAHLLPEAGATQERTLEAVRCSPMLGGDFGTDARTPSRYSPG